MLKLHKHYKLIRFILVFLLIFVLVYLHRDYQWSKKRKYYYCKNKSNLTSVNKLAESIRDNTKLELGKNVYEREYILPCGSYYSSVRDLKTFMRRYKNKTFFLTPNNIIIGNKYMLWKTLIDYYGINEASEITPYTYLMPDDYNKYRKEYSPKRKLIFKTNDQRQEGLYVTTALLPLSMIKREKFLVAQKFMINPLLYCNRKTTFRLYLILVTQNNKLDAYVYNDGLIYYTKNKYSFKSNKEFYNIASFHDSKKLYASGYPLTLSSFLRTLHDRNAKKLLDTAISKLKKLVIAIRKPIFNNVYYNYNRCCEVFGVDFFPSETYNCHILECNIGPGMETFNKEDEKMRNNLFKSMIILLEHGQSKRLNKIY